MTEKKFKVGMYGGKFCPLHTGHEACLQEALRQCEAVDLVLVLGGVEDERIQTDFNFNYHRVDPAMRDVVTPERRVEQLYRLAMKYQAQGYDVRPVVVSVSSCRDQDGREDWDQETPLILAGCRRFDAVFGSEEEYLPYFQRAYPWAQYVCIDPERSRVPISASQIRAMTYDQAKEWMV